MLRIPNVIFETKKKNKKQKKRDHLLSGRKEATEQNFILEIINKFLVFLIAIEKIITASSKF